jgi:hypothetical protein
MPSDMSIQQAGNAPANVQIRPGPVYLVSLAEEALSPFFLATRLDEGPSTVKTVGIFANKNAKLGNLTANYQMMIGAAKPEDMVEISFPWHQVISIQNLIYRHKGIKQ